MKTSSPSAETKAPRRQGAALGKEPARVQQPGQAANSDASTKRIYLSGTYVFEGIQNHYPPERGSQSASVVIRISSDKSEGGISVVKVRFENQVFRQSGAVHQEVVRPPEVTLEGTQQVLQVFQPMSSLSAWLHILHNLPKRSYYITYGIEEKRAWAFVVPVAQTAHVVGC